MNTCLLDSVVLHLHSEKYLLEAVAQVSVMDIMHVDIFVTPSPTPQEFLLRYCVLGHILDKEVEQFPLPPTPNLGQISCIRVLQGNRTNRCVDKCIGKIPLVSSSEIGPVIDYVKDAPNV